MNQPFIFSKKDYVCFALAGVLLIAGFALIAFDKTDNGFGIGTLWIAPPLLMVGFLLPVAGIAGLENVSFPKMRSLKKSNSIAFIPFIASFLVYLRTLEPTASLWDCSEFIASAYKLQVPHTPGTPLSLLIARLFTMLALDNVAAVAWTINLMSALFSSMAVFMLYRIIYHLGKQLLPQEKKCRSLLALSSCAGSLCLAFSDTFWFSAVEAETYAAACFFLLLLVWLTLTGRSLVGPPRSRRMILIFYMAGLSYCIHPMCLLALPLMPFSWYSFDHTPGLRKTALLISGGFLLVLLINRFIAIGMFELVFLFDLVFVNQIHLPFYSGALIAVFSFALVSMMALRKWAAARPYIWSLIFLLMGFAPYMLLFLRSNHNPPIDETNPENLPLIKAYMNRESYPTSPLLYGPYFDARIVDVGVRKQIYYKDTDQYKVAGALPEYRYDSRQTFLPRMYSNDASHVERYRAWTGLRENERPGFTDNLRFMFTYQLGHMYFRYFFWNFAGRAGEIQNSGWLLPWEGADGVPFEKARNQYWMVPLMLGIAGAVFQWRRDRNNFLSVMSLFLIMGVVLAIYLNAPPNEPRERDYIYVGSFIAFGIWIGLGLISLGTLVGGKRRWLALFAIFSLSIPLWMLYQNYDDHDRSGRRLQVDNARNTLSSCAPHSILFTGGDNDTFPLWYLQEVEGYRTDVRVMVLSYMNTDWYINQLRRSYYDSPAFHFTLDEKDYRQYGPNDVVYVQESIKDEIDVGEFLRLLKNEHPALTMASRDGEPYHIVPSRSLRIKVPKDGVQAGRDTMQGDVLRLHLASDYMSKNLLAILDLFVSNGWKRPIYFNYTSLNSVGVDIAPYVIEEGPVFRLRGERNDSGSVAVDTFLSYRNIVQRADYSNIEDSAVHFSYEDHFTRIIVPIRQSFNDLANAFLKEGNTAMAKEVISQATDQLYGKHLRPSYTNIEAAEILLALDESERANGVSKAAFDYCYQKVTADRAAHRRSSDLDLYLVRRSAELLAQTGNPGYLDRLPVPGASMD